MLVAQVVCCLLLLLEGAVTLAAVGGAGYFYSSALRWHGFTTLCALGSFAHHNRGLNPAGENGGWTAVLWLAVHALRMSRLLGLRRLLFPLRRAPAAQLSVGGQIGSPTGLSVKLGAGPGALVVAAGWDLDDSVEAEVHYLLRSRPLQGARRTQLFYGPGVYIDANSPDADLGISLGVGLETLLAPEIELYGIVSPRLRLIEETAFDLGLGLGLRLRL